MKHCGNCLFYINGYCWSDITETEYPKPRNEQDARDKDDYCDEWEHDLLNDEE